MIPKEYHTETVLNLLRQWASENFRLNWHIAPILADALQDAGYGDGKGESSTLNDLRNPYGGLISKYGISTFTDVLVLPELTENGWDEAFGYAGEPNMCGSGVPTAVPGQEIDLKPFSRWDVAKLYGADPGENDGKNWICYGKLRDGRCFFLSAGCDYTGWD